MRGSFFTYALVAAVISLVFFFIISFNEATPPAVISPTLIPVAPKEFVLLADTGAATAAQFAVAKSIQDHCTASMQCQAAFIAGDVIYEEGVTSVNDSQFQTKFEEPYKDVALPFYIAYGNHDYLGCQECYIAYSKLSNKWKMPSRYYAQPFDNVTFYVIDTERFDTEQQEWLQLQLQNSQTPYNIVVGHRPIKTFETTKIGENWHGKEELKGIICTAADFYVAGHAHILEDNGLIEECTAKQLVVGGGGAYVREVSTQSDGAFFAAKNGFATLSVSPTKLQYTFYDEQGLLLYRSE